FTMFFISAEHLVYGLKKGKAFVRPNRRPISQGLTFAQKMLPRNLQEPGTPCPAGGLIREMSGDQTIAWSAGCRNASSEGRSCAGGRSPARACRRSVDPCRHPTLGFHIRGCSDRGRYSSSGG